MYKDIYVFPAIITKFDEDDYNIGFPDFEEIIAFGETIEEAYLMAEDALKLCLYDLYENEIEIGDATKLGDVNLLDN